MKKLIEFVSIIALLFVVGAGAYSFFNLGVFNDLDAAVQVFDGLGWFVSLFGIATIFTSYLIVIADTKFIFRLLAIPAWLAFSFALLAAIDQFIGYPYPSIPPKSQVLQYRVISNEDRTKTIEAWMYNQTDDQTRAYSFPHTPNREEALHQAMQSRARGEKVSLDLEPDNRASTDEPPTPEEMIEKHDIRHQGLPLKEGEDTTMRSDPAPQQQQDNSDKILLKLPGGDIIEIQPGNTFTITDQGEIEITSKKVHPPYGTKPGTGRGAVTTVPDNDHFDASDYEGVVGP